MRWSITRVPLLLVLLVPLVAAQLPNTLTGRLASETVLELDGVLLVGPPDTPHPGFASLRNLSVAARTENQTLLQAQEVRLETLQWNDCAVPEEPQPSQVLSCLPSGTPTPPQTATNATLSLIRWRDAPQMTLRDEDNAWKSQRFRLNATGAQCDIGLPRVGEQIQFPESDDASLASPQTRAPHKGEVVSICTAGTFRADDPYEVLVYGMDLWLSSDEEDRLIRTGTFQEPIAPGVYRTVSHVLRVRYVHGPFEVNAPFETSLRVYAPGFLGVGKLRVGASYGDLQWGLLNRTGPLDPFAATGLFQIRSPSTETILVEGHTLESPMVPETSDAVPSPILGQPAVFLALAGFSLLLLLGRVLWSLYSRLAPGRLLEHPRRSLIVELVRNEPGIEIQTVARTLNMGWTKALYHVSRLQQGGHLKVQKILGRTALFVPNPEIASRETSLALFRRPTPRRVHEALKERPDQDQHALANQLGLGRPAVCKSLRLLEQAGLLRKERVGHSFRYLLKDG